MKKFIDDARKILSIVTRNPYFVEDHPDWGKRGVVRNKLQDSFEEKNLAKLWCDKLGWTPQYVKKVPIPK